MLIETSIGRRRNLLSFSQKNASFYFIWIPIIRYRSETTRHICIISWNILHEFVETVHDIIVYNNVRKRIFSTFLNCSKWFSSSISNIFAKQKWRRFLWQSSVRIFLNYFLVIVLKVFREILNSAILFIVKCDVFQVSMID